jgi:hypothetical protein
VSPVVHREQGYPLRIARPGRLNAITYPVTYPQSAYTAPTEARAERVTFDTQQMHIHLADGRTISVPLTWIPSLAHAAPADLEKYQIGWDGLLIYWDPDDGPINEDLLVATYLRGGKDTP